jgi:multidrug efflux pump
LTIGIAFAGVLALLRLPVAPLPQVDFPTLMIQASMSGASPEVMAATVAAPLERHLGFISDVTEMTSRSSLGSTQITLQFGLNRDIDGAARDVEAAINAARADLPSNLRSNPTYRKYNPSDSPILLMVLTSSTRTSGQLYDSAATVLQQKLSQIEGVGNVDVGGSSLPAVRVELNLTRSHTTALVWRMCELLLLLRTQTVRKARLKKGVAIFRSTPTIKQPMHPITADWLSFIATIGRRCYRILPR